MKHKLLYGISGLLALRALLQLQLSPFLSDLPEGSFQFLCLF